MRWTVASLPVWLVVAGVACVGLLTMPRARGAERQGPTPAGERQPETPVVGDRTADGNPDHVDEPPTNEFVYLPRCVPLPDYWYDIIYFEAGSAELRPVVTPLLEVVAVSINSWDQSVSSVEVEGHAADDERRPRLLAKNRAEAVRDDLVARGVSPERLVLRSYGKERPKCREKTTMCRSENRRVRFKLVKRGELGPHPAARSEKR